MKTIHKACPCVLKPDFSGTEILVFRHPLAGVQVPKGTVEYGEDIEHAVLRELTEETGVEDGKIEKKICQFDRHVGAGENEDGELERHVWHLFHITANESRGKWIHRPTGNGIETKFTFECFWHLLGDDDSEFHPIFRKVLALVSGYIVEQGAQPDAFGVG